MRGSILIGSGAALLKVTWPKMPGPCQGVAAGPYG
jgi:hypothetical protein